MTKIKIAILASGNGSNAENIANYLKDHEYLEVDLICTNNSKAFVLDRARNLGLESLVFTKSDLESGALFQKLVEREIQYLILAGFLLKIPSELIRNYTDRIINIHPSLLPKYGGRGMYGDRVHKAVIKNNEKFSGISIHLVNEEYDKGKILKQLKTEVSDFDDSDSLAKKIHALEHAHFPQVIEQYISSRHQT